MRTAPASRQFGRVRFEQAAQFEGLLDVEVGPFGDTHTAIRVGRGKAVVHEALERGADRRAADSNSRARCSSFSWAPGA